MFAVYRSFGSDHCDFIIIMASLFRKGGKGREIIH